MDEEEAEVEEDGWAFWSRVYEDPKLRSEIDSNSGGYATVTEVLSEKTLERTRIAIDHLPPFCNEEDIRNLIEPKQDHPSVMKVTISGRKLRRATVEFYVATDAADAIKYFHGFRFRSCTLRVWSCADPEPPSSETTWNTQFSDEAYVSEESSLSGNAEKVSEEEEWWDAENQPSGTCSGSPDGVLEMDKTGFLDETTDENEDPQEKCSYSDLLQELHDYLAVKGPVEFNDARIGEFIQERASPSVALAFQTWPLGAFRTQRKLELVGKYLCVKEDEVLALTTCQAMGLPLMHKESWEPFHPAQIRSSEDMKEYFMQLMGHFGPIWIHDHLILKYFLNSMSPDWRGLVSRRGIEEALGPEATTVYIKIGDIYYLARDLEIDDGANERL